MATGCSVQTNFSFKPRLDVATKPRLLSVPLFSQTSDYTCGSTSLKSVCWYYGRRITEKELAQRCGITRAGIDHGPLIRGARRVGARVFATEDGTVNQLRWFTDQGFPVIVGWWSSDAKSAFDPSWSRVEREDYDCGHYSVCFGVGGDRIWLMDPQWRYRNATWSVVGKRSIPIPAFRRSWYDTDTARYLRVSRWYAVVHFSERRFAPRLRCGRDYPS